MKIPGRTRPGRAAPLMACLALTVAAGQVAVSAIAADAAAPSWTVSPVVKPKAVQQSFAGVSCVTSTDCVAVGANTSRSGRGVALAEIRTASGWRLHPAHVPTGHNHPSLAAVSCLSLTACMAVGNSTGPAGETATLAEWWNGNDWIITPTPDPAPGVNNGNALVSVACTSTANCIAVGYFGPYGNFNAPLAERWNGKRWLLTELPLTSPDSPLTGVACISALRCLAVGYDGDNGTGIVNWWNGKHWQNAPMPVPAGANSGYPSGVTCMAAQNACMVLAGAYSTSGPGSFYSALWRGGGWTLQSLPVQSGSIAERVMAISCVTTTSCEAVGYWLTSYYLPPHAVSVRWDGSSWQSDTPALPASDGSELDGVSCVGTTCMTVGDYSTFNPPDTRPLAATLARGAWSVEQPVEIPAPSPSELSAISCVRADWCMGAGFAGSSYGDPFSEVWSQGLWRLVNMAALPNVVTQPFGISCASANDCVAVGLSAPISATPVGTSSFAERWNGRAWQLMSVPTLGGATDAVLNAVSCSAANDCTAVGSYRNASGQQRPLIAQLSRGKWAVMGLAAPDAASTLLGVSCPAVGSCVAVGSGTARSGDPVPLTETLTGNHWSRLVAPEPSGGFAGSLHAVSCTSVRQCLAVGDVRIGGGGTLGEAWDGKRWMPSVLRSDGSLAGVSCLSAANCFATGYAFNSALGKAVAARWNGHSWQQQQVSIPTKSTSSTLGAVSCVPSRCMAVGGYVLGQNYGYLALAEAGP